MVSAMKSKELYYCDFCGKSFVAKINLYRHLSKNEDCYDFYFRDKVENIDYVTCKICGKRFSRITSWHLKTHNMTTEEYLSLFPNTILTSQETVEKRKQTNLDRYGVEYAIQAKEISDKMKKTCLKKYGVENPQQSKKIRDKTKQTCLDRYGVENPLQSEEIRNKAKQTCLKKYGVENPWQSEEIRNKAKQTCLEKYGVKNPFESEEIKDKIKQTNLKRYNVENPTQSEKIQNKIRQTCLKKYGVQNPAQSEKIKDKVRNTMKQKYGIYYSITPRFSLSSQELFTSIELILLDLYPNIECFYATNKKIELGGKLVTNEYQVLVDSVSNDKKVRFLDFYIPELKKWIEFDESYHDSTDQLYDDKIREEEVRAVIPDIQLLRVKEEDYLNNKDYIIEKCINFILS